MMRIYEAPDARWTAFETADVIATSETEPEFELEEDMTNKG